MHTFRVWATLPKKVEVQVNAEKFPMTVDTGGWWSAEVPSAKAGDDYGFILDGEGPFPDPRSPSQPNGVHKLSRLVDQNQFQWGDQNWQPKPLSSAIVYELHLGTFTPAGTFLSAIEKLDHLIALGVTHVELMPVVEYSGNHGWGYDGVDLFAPHHALGQPDDLKKTRQCLPRAGPRGNFGCRLQPSWSGGKLPRQVWAIFHQKIRLAVGRRHQF